MCFVKISILHPSSSIHFHPQPPRINTTLYLRVRDAQPFDHQARTHHQTLQHHDTSHDATRYTHPIVTMDSYERLERVGEGTYGVVFKARDRRNGQLVAIKKIRLEHESEGVPSTAIREIALLRECHHENLVHLRDVYHQDASIYLVFEFLDSDLKRYMDNNPLALRNPAMVKKFFYQMLQVWVLACVCVCLPCVCQVVTMLTDTPLVACQIQCSHPQHTGACLLPHARRPASRPQATKRTTHIVTPMQMHSTSSWLPRCWWTLHSIGSSLRTLGWHAPLCPP